MSFGVSQLAAKLAGTPPEDLVVEEAVHVVAHVGSITPLID